jgi:tRNA threonylcarbamoyladenosine biosynthesis protein TsaB
VRLIGSIHFLLGSADWRLEEIDLIAACLGPGSFTGIRIGVATALGLAQTLGLPFAGISGLDALAYGVSVPEGLIGVVLDAQRSQIYYAEYSKRGNRMRNLESAFLCNPEDLKHRLEGRQMFLVGDGTVRYGRRLGILGKGWPMVVNADLFIASGIGRLALKRRRSWRVGDHLRADPLYIRPPDAMKSKRRPKK